MTRTVAATMTVKPQATTPKVQTREIISSFSTFLFTIFCERYTPLMSSTTEEQTFVEAELGDQVIHMGVDPIELENVGNIPFWEAMQHEVLMRNIPGFVS